jgi:hypothetical protein
MEIIILIKIVVLWFTSVLQGKCESSKFTLK